MSDDGTTWVVVADGAHLRVFEERRRAAELRELTDWTMRQESSDRPMAGGHPATVHSSTGAARHAGKDDNPTQEAEARFLGRVAKRLQTAAERGEFHGLVLIAPPKALGLLRAKLGDHLAARVEASDPHDRIGDDAEAIRVHLRQARAHA